MEIYKFTGTDFSSKAQNFLAESLIGGKDTQVSYVDKKEYRIVKEEKCTLSLTRRIMHLFLRVVSLNLIYILAKNKNRLIEKKVKPLFPHYLDGQNKYSPINLKDTLLEISKFLKPKDLRNLKLASKHHNEVLSKNATHYLNYNPDVSLDKLGFNTPEKSVNYIKENALYITSLCIESIDFDDLQSKELFSALTSCKKLTRLNTSSKICIADQQLKLLGKCTPIRDLHLCMHDDATDQGFACIQNLKHLESLKLSASGPSKVTGVGIQALANLEKLKNLDLRSLFKLDEDNRFEEVCKLKGLESLKFLPMRWKKEAYTKLPNLTKLKALEVGSDFFCVIEEISQLTQLESLRLCNDGGKLSREDFAKLSSLTNLKVLQLGLMNNLTDEMLEIVAGFSQLKVFTLIICRQITDNGVEKLKNLKQLEKIELVYTGVSKNISEMVSKKFASSPKLALIHRKKV